MTVDFGILRGRNFAQDALAGVALADSMQQRKMSKQDRERQESERKRADELMRGIAERMQNPDFALASSVDFTELAQINPQLAQTQMSQFEMLSKKRQQEYVSDMVKARDAMAMGDKDGAINILAERIERIQKIGGDPSDSLRAMQIGMNNPDKFVEGINNMVRARTEAGMDGGATAGIREWQSIVKDANLSPDELRNAARIKLGLDPRAVGSAAMTMSEDPDTVQRVAKAEAEIVGAKKRAEIVARMELEPELQAKLTEAVAYSKQQADAFAKNRSNESARNLYGTVRDQLEEAFAGTTTGSLVGLAPAFTADQRIADGAVNIMRPVIKDVVRSAGEGTFTDQDQKLIDQMLPTRRDSSEAIQSKLLMLDNFINMKLAEQSTSTPNDQGGEDDEFSGFSIVN